MEPEECWQVELATLLSHQRLIMTVKCWKKLKVGGSLADPAMQESTVGEWGGPRSLVTGPNTQNNC